MTEIEEAPHQDEASLARARVTTKQCPAEYLQPSPALPLLARVHTSVGRWYLHVKDSSLLEIPPCCTHTSPPPQSSFAPVFSKTVTMHLAPPPNSRDLLPPLLACLPTAFISPRPPPALLPLLAPVLRQRLNFLSASTPTGRDGWLPLLSWDQERASKLPAVIERMELEPHPVSGEIELDDVRPAKYRRLDNETLHSRLEAEQFDLSPVYVWCESDEHGGTGPGWKLAELRSLEDIEDGTQWYDSQSQADDAWGTTSLAVPQANGNSYPPPANEQQDQDDDANDDYWAAYDRTPGRTPAQNRSPAPRSNPMLQMSNRGGPSQAETNYFARYGSEVQPALDSHDPDEEHPELGQSTLTGDALSREQARQVAQHEADHTSTSYLQPLDTSRRDKDGPHDSAMGSALERSAHSDLSMPRPISPTSSHSSVDKLEEQAEALSAAEKEEPADDRAQMSIKQHISTDIKSLFRLARSVGVERQEFERIVRRELEVLSLLEIDE